MKEAEEILFPLLPPTYLLFFSPVEDITQESRAWLTQSIKLCLPGPKQVEEYLRRITGNTQLSEFLY